MKFEHSQRETKNISDNDGMGPYAGMEAANVAIPMPSTSSSVYGFSEDTTQTLDVPLARFYCIVTPRDEQHRAV